MPNLELNFNSSATDLILRSRTILAFNTSVLAESLLLNKKVVIPIYEEASNKYKDYILWKDSQSFYQARSEKELSELLYFKKNCNQKLTLLDREQIITESFGYCDGKNTDRMFNSIFNYLENSKINKNLYY